MVDHVAVALLYRCKSSGYFVGYYDQWSLPSLEGLAIKWRAKLTKLIQLRRFNLESTLRIVLTNKEGDHCLIVKAVHSKEIREHEDCLSNFCHVVHPSGIESVAAMAVDTFFFS